LFAHFFTAGRLCAAAKPIDKNICLTHISVQSKHLQQREQKKELLLSPKQNKRTGFETGFRTMAP